MREGLLSPSPVLTLGADGTVTSVAGDWPELEGLVGAPITSLVGPAHRDAVGRLVVREWAGAIEAAFTLASGRRVGLAAARDGAAVRVCLHDMTRRELLALAGEQRRRSVAMAELAGSVARELTDPMSIVQGRLELLLDLGVSDPTVVRRHLEIALEHARRVTATLRNLRMVGRGRVSRVVPVDLPAVVAEALDLVGPRRDRVLCDLGPGETSAGGEPAVVARVLSSLLRHCLEATGRSPVHVRVRRIGGRVRVRIGPRGRFTGVEVPASEWSLDTSLLASIGGELVVRRGPTGTSFEVVLAPTPGGRSRRRPVTDRLLVVGSQVLHEAVSSLLDRDGFGFDCLTTGPEALGWLDQGGEASGVVAELLLDGDLSGFALADQMVALRPALGGRVVVVGEGPLVPTGIPVVPLCWPLTRSAVLDALGRGSRG